MRSWLDVRAEGQRIRRGGGAVVATWNIGDGPDSKKAAGLDRIVHHGADVIGLQEAGDRSRMIDRWCELTGWQAWFGDGSPGAASVPILWNPKSIRAIRTGTTPATDATNVGRAGAGPSVMKAKVWNRVRFDGDESPPFVFINGHIVPSVYLPKRRRLARRQIAVLAEMVERRVGKIAVAAVGDFNMRPNHSLTKPLRNLGMKQHTKAATHGRRTIDHAWTLGCTASTEVLEMPSDHRAVLVTIKETR